MNLKIKKEERKKEKERKKKRKKEKINPEEDEKMNTCSFKIISELSQAITVNQ